MILEYGFKHNSAEKCIYSKFTENFGVIICLSLSKAYLSSTFQMKDVGEVDKILGVKVKRHSGGFALFQSHYIKKTLTKFNHLHIKEANTPYDVSIHLNENPGKVVAQVEYASAIGSLMYGKHCT